MRPLTLAIQGPPEPTAAAADRPKAGQLPGPQRGPPPEQLESPKVKVTSSRSLVLALWFQGLDEGHGLFFLLINTLWAELTSFSHHESREAVKGRPAHLSRPPGLGLPCGHRPHSLGSWKKTSHLSPGLCGRPPGPTPRFRPPQPHPICGWCYWLPTPPQHAPLQTSRPHTEAALPTTATLRPGDPSDGADRFRDPPEQTATGHPTRPQGPSSAGGPGNPPHPSSPRTLSLPCHGALDG